MSQESQSSPVGHVPTELASREGQLDPFPWYETMRETSPVRYDENRGCWDVFRYDDVDRVLNDHETFSSRLTADGEATDGSAEKETMIRVDPPEHSRLRDPSREFFTPGNLRAFRSELERIAAEKIDEALAGGDQIEFVSDVAYPIPITVIAEILGLPLSDREKFREWSHRISSPQDPAQEADAGGSDGQLRTNPEREINNYFREIISRRKENPGDDLISEVIHPGEDGTQLTESEIVDFCNLLLVAGHITTVSFLTSAVWMFTEHDIISEIRDGSISLELALDEVLRYRSPLQVMPRMTQTEVELQGERIPAGERVVGWIGAANRDERVFESPEGFVPDRSPNKHMAFGTGVHYCLGAPLARLEADVALRAFFERVKDVEILIDKFKPIMHPSLYGLMHLPIAVTT